MRTLPKTNPCYSTAPINRINVPETCFCCTFPQLWFLASLLGLREKEKWKYKISPAKGVKSRFLFAGFKKANYQFMITK